MSAGTAYVFGYGSLAAARPDGFVTELPGARRAWTVAMDNTLDLPGYKHYLDADGHRPDVCVAFLDLVDHVAGVVDGVCLPVDRETLVALDRRERQYERVDVTDRVVGARGPTWTYVGRADSRMRAEAARGQGRLRVARAYLDTVHAAFALLGADHRARFDATTDLPGVPVVELRRVDTA